MVFSVSVIVSPRVGGTKAGGAPSGILIVGVPSKNRRRSARQDEREKNSFSAAVPSHGIRLSVIGA
jgi:hypothetical protein